MKAIVNIGSIVAQDKRQDSPNNTLTCPNTCLPECGSKQRFQDEQRLINILSRESYPRGSQHTSNGQPPEQTDPQQKA